MTNWEECRKEINTRAGIIAMDRHINYSQAYIEAIIEISGIADVEEAIDWLTQEAEQRVDEFNRLLENSVRVEKPQEAESAKQAMDNIEFCDYYEYDEKDRAVEVPKGTCTTCKKKKCKMYETPEPQQSKVRFIEDTDGVLHQIKIEDISDIGKGYWNFRECDDMVSIKLKNGKSILVFKSKTEVIQQLGIEVV